MAEMVTIEKSFVVRDEDIEKVKEFITAEMHKAVPVAAVEFDITPVPTPKGGNDE